MPRQAGSTEEAICRAINYELKRTLPKLLMPSARALLVKVGDEAPQCRRRLDLVAIKAGSRSGNQLKLAILQDRHLVKVTVICLLKDLALRVLGDFHEVSQLSVRVGATQQASWTLLHQLVHAAICRALAVAPFVVAPHHLKHAFTELLL